MGAFPVRRGESDEESVDTSLALLERGEAVVIFPEGTRIRAGSLAKPKRGVGRLALQSGAPVVPIAITGSEHARDGWKIKPVRVHVRIGPALTYPRVENPSPFLAGEVTERIWPCVGLQWEWLGGLPPLRMAAVIGGGSMGTAIASVLARAGLEVQLGCRTTSQAARLLDDRENSDYLPGVALHKAIEPKAVREIEFAGVDLVVLAVPCSACRPPSARSARGWATAAPSWWPRRASSRRWARRPPPTSPSGCAPAPSPAWAAPCTPARRSRSAPRWCVATRNPDLRRQLREVLDAGGLTVETTDDVTGAELAACAKNAAALASGAAAARGANLAGAAAGRVFSEVHDLAVASGGRSETFAGLAGAGDLVATAIAAGSRNRRAGELVGSGMPSVPGRGRGAADGGVARDRPAAQRGVRPRGHRRPDHDRPAQGARRRVIARAVARERAQHEPEAEDPRRLTARAAPSRLRNGWTTSPTSSDSIATSRSSTGLICATCTRTPTTGSATTTTPRT